LDVIDAAKKTNADPSFACDVLEDNIRNFTRAFRQINRTRIITRDPATMDAQDCAINSDNLTMLYEIDRSAVKSLETLMKSVRAYTDPNSLGDLRSKAKELGISVNEINRILGPESILIHSNAEQLTDSSEKITSNKRKFDESGESSMEPSKKIRLEPNDDRATSSLSQTNTNHNQSPLDYVLEKQSTETPDIYEVDGE
jgi:hypothetical protein